MDEPSSHRLVDRRAYQALILWGVYLVATVLINGTLPFLYGVDVRGWTYSPVKDVLVNVIIYWGIFLAAPLVLVKGWVVVKQPAFMIPLLVAAISLGMRTFYRPATIVLLLVIVYLHWRFNLAEMGVRSSGWRGDLLAVILVGLIYMVPVLLQGRPAGISPYPALIAGLDRLLMNPATTTEVLFYFGFLAERLSFKTGRLLTPLLVAALYTVHEMTNPEYWYEGIRFPFVFVGVAIITLIYLWRRSIIVIWLGEGLGRFMSRLFAGVNSL